MNAPIINMSTELAPANRSTALELHRRALTDRQQMVLDFIAGFTRTHGYGPTLREIGRWMSIRSTNGVNDHLRALERKGYIRRTSQLSRSIVLLDREEPGNDGKVEARDLQMNALDVWRAEALALRHLLHRVAVSGARQQGLSAEMLVVLADVHVILRSVPGAGRGET